MFGLTRRRSIAFVAEKFFVVEDEVCGPAAGKLTLRNGLGLGTLEETAPGNYVYRDGDAGLRMLVCGPDGAAVTLEKDWFSEAMHERSLRPVVRVDAARSPGAGAQRFFTILCPFSGKAPDVVLKSPSCVSIDGQDYKIN